VKKRKRLLLIFASLAAVLLAGYGSLRLTAPRHRITEENFEAIQKGMTEEEVEAILGVPAGVYVSGARTGWYRLSEGRGFSLKGPVLIWLFGGNEWVAKEWVAKEISVVVWFHKDGRVAQTCKGWTESGNEPFLAKLRRWLGM